MEPRVQFRRAVREWAQARMEVEAMTGFPFVRSFRITRVNGFLSYLEEIPAQRRTELCRMLVEQFSACECAPPPKKNVALWNEYLDLCARLSRERHIWDPRWAELRPNVQTAVIKRTLRERLAASDIRAHAPSGEGFLCWEVKVKGFAVRMVLNTTRTYPLRLWHEIEDSEGNFVEPLGELPKYLGFGEGSNWQSLLSEDLDPTIDAAMGIAGTYTSLCDGWLKALEQSR